MQEEGIYRLSGIKSAVESMVNLFEERGHTDKEIDLSKELDINVVSNCLKGFFRKVFIFFKSKKIFEQFFFFFFFFFLSFFLFFSSYQNL